MLCRSVWCGGICLFLDNKSCIWIKKQFSTFGYSYSKILFKHSVIDISLGYLFTVFKDNANNLWSFGDNSHGQLGTGDNENRDTPFFIKGLPQINHFCCSKYTTICSDYSGNGWIFGNESNRIYSIQLLPRKIDNLNNITRIECNYTDVICLTNKGSALLYGLLLSKINNEVSELVFKCPIVSVSMGESYILMILNNGDLYQYNYSLEINFESLVSNFIKIDIPPIINISCGDNHCMAIDNEYNFYVWGENNNGELGLGDRITRNSPVKNPYINNIAVISRGGSFSYIKTKDNKVYHFGNNEIGQLCTDKRERILIPELIKDDYIKCENIRVKSARK